MKYCTNCGEPLKDDARFCPICGKPARDPIFNDQAAPAVENAVNEAAPVVENAVNEAAPVVENAVNEAAPVVNAVNEAAPAVENAVNEAAPVVENAVNEAAPVVENAVNEAAPVVENAVNEAAPVVENAVNEAAPALEETAPAFAPASPAFAPASPAFAPASPAFVPDNEGMDPANNTVSGEKAPAAPAEEEGRKRGKKEKKKGKRGLVALLIALGALLVLAGAAAALYFTGAYIKLLPASRLKLALVENTLVDKALDKAFEADKKISKLNANLHVTAEMDTSLSALFSELTIYKELLKNMALDIDLDFDGAQQNMHLGVSYKGTGILDGTLVSDEGMVGVYVPQLDENYYTITRDALAALSLDGSGAPASVSPDTSALDEAKTRKDVKAILKILCGLSTKSNTDIERKADVKIFNGETTVTADKYTIRPSEDEFKEVIIKLADHLESDGSYLGKRFLNLYAYYRAQQMALKVEPDPYNPDYSSGADLPENPYEYLREHAGEIAKQLADNNVKFVFYIDGTEIISQRIVFKDGSFGVDHLKDKEEERFYIFEDNEGDLSVLDVRNDISDKNRLKGTAVASYIQSESGSSESHEIGTCVYDFDKTKESVIGTYEGSARINVQGQEIVTVTVTQDGDTMKHEIVINAETFSDQLKTLTIRIDASEGKKIEAPSVPPTDLSGKSAEEISRIFENMFSQLQQVLTDALM